MNALRSPTFVAMTTLLFLVTIPYAIPGASRFRLLTPLPPGQGLTIAAPPPTASVGETAIAHETKPEIDLAQPEEPALPPHAADAIPQVKSEKPPRSIEDRSGHALDPFYAALAAVERKEPKSIARISYYGDSIVASDSITATLRRKLQKRFGDAGHGFVLMANAWPAGYFHNDVYRFAQPGWHVSRVVGPFAKDGFYGLGGVSFRSDGPGLISRFGTAREGKYGRAVSRFAVDYLEQPHGGAMEIKIDGALRDTVDTSGASPKSAVKIYDVPDGEHVLEVRAAAADVRTFGVWLERDTPGVVLDALGIQGCRIRFLDQIDDAHWAEQLRLRDPSLVVFQYGMNESVDGEYFPLDQYESTMKAVLDQVKAALPKGSCMLVGPMDRTEKTADGYHSRNIIPKLAAIQQRVAADVGCAYWDTLGAMGGFGSMAAWVERGLGAEDLMHPTNEGAAVLASWIYLAIIEGFEAYKAREHTEPR